MTKDEKNELLLTQLVFMFQTAALGHMGKLKNPLTDKVERDLAQARISIDMLEMLQSKMHGNLTSTEDRMLTNTLRELHLNYVDEAAKPDAPASAEPPPPDHQSSSGPAPAA